MKKQLLHIFSCLALGGVFFLLGNTYKFTPVWKQLEGKPHHKGLKKALQIYLKSGDAVASLPFFEQALQEGALTEKAYQHYADACFVTQNYDKALTLYSEAVLFKSNKAALAQNYYKMACACAQTNQICIVNNLVEARKYDFSDYQALLSDPLLADFRTQHDFVPVFSELFSTNNRALTQLFVYQFPQATTANYSLSPQALLDHNSGKTISGYFNQFVEGTAKATFSRGGGNNFEHEVAFSHTKNFHLVIYSEESRWAEGVLPKNYYAMTFDLDGKIIDKLEVAQRIAPQNCKTFDVQNNQIVIYEYDLDWKPDVYNKYAEWNSNDLVKAKLKAQKNFSIDKNGNFIQHKSTLTNQDG